MAQPMDGAFVDDIDEANRLLVRAEDFRLTEQDRSAALTYVLHATRTSTSPALLIRCAAHLPHAFSNFPGREDDIYSAAYDLVESDEREVRLAAYPVLPLLAREARAEKVRESVDILLQSMLQPPPDSLTPLEKEAITSALLLVLDAQPRCFVDALIEWFDSAATWDWLSEARVQRAILSVLSDPARSIDGAAERKFIFGVGRCFETAPLALRLTALRYILPFPSLTGAASTRAHASHLLHLLVNTALLFPDAADLLPVLAAIDDLAEATAARAPPDPRWYLVLYARRPVMAAEWAHKGSVTRPGEAPTRLVDWLLAGWSLWRQEYRTAKETGRQADVDEEIQFARLGVEVAQTTMKQIGMMVPRGVTLTSIRRHMEALEANLIIVYFIFLKMRGKIPDLCNDYERQRLADIRRVAAEGVEEARQASHPAVQLKRWENVLEMSKELLEPTKLTTVHPSWASAVAKQQAEEAAQMEVEIAAGIAQAVDAASSAATTAPAITEALAAPGTASAIVIAPSPLSATQSKIDPDAMAVDSPTPAARASRPRATMLMDGPIPSQSASPQTMRKRREPSPDAAIASALSGISSDPGRPRVVLNAQFARLLGVPSTTPSPRRLLRRNAPAAAASAPTVGIAGPLAAVPVHTTARPAFGVKGAAQETTASSPGLSLAERLRGVASDGSPNGTTKRKAELVATPEAVRPIKQIKVFTGSAPIASSASPPAMTALSIRHSAANGHTAARETDAMDGVQDASGRPVSGLPMRQGASLLDRLRNPSQLPANPSQVRQDQQATHTPIKAVSSRPGLSLIERLGSGSTTPPSRPQAIPANNSASRQQSITIKQAVPAVPPSSSISAQSPSLADRLGINGKAHRQPNQAIASSPTSTQAISGSLLSRMEGGAPSTPSSAPKKPAPIAHGSKSLLDRMGDGGRSPAGQTPNKPRPTAKQAASNQASPLSLAERLSTGANASRAKR